MAHLVCPECGAEDSIVEYGTVVFMNYLSVTEEANVESEPGPTDWDSYETMEYWCQDCDERWNLEEGKTLDLASLVVTS